MLSFGMPPESNSSSPLMPVLTRSIFPTVALLSVWMSAINPPSGGYKDACIIILLSYDFCMWIVRMVSFYYINIYENIYIFITLNI